MLILSARSVFRTVVLCSYVAFGQSAASQLSSSSWRLVKFQSGGGKIITPDDSSKYTVTFNADNTVSVRIDCNRGHGAWRSTGANQIRFGPMALTRAFCPPGPLNDRIPRDWEDIRSYMLRDGHLFLWLMADAGHYEFEPWAGKV